MFKSKYITCQVFRDVQIYILIYLGMSKSKYLCFCWPGSPWSWYCNYCRNDKCPINIKKFKFFYIYYYFFHICYVTERLADVKHKVRFSLSRKNQVYEGFSTEIYRQLNIYWSLFIPFHFSFPIIFLLTVRSRQLWNRKTTFGPKIRF